MLKGVSGKISLGMSRSFRRIRRKSKDALGYLIAIFVFLPGVLGIIGLISDVPLSLLRGLLTIYYLVAVVVVLVGGLAWLERHLS